MLRASRRGGTGQGGPVPSGRCAQARRRAGAQPSPARPPPHLPLSFFDCTATAQQILNGTFPIHPVHASHFISGAPPPMRCDSTTNAPTATSPDPSSGPAAACIPSNQQICCTSSNCPVLPPTRPPSCLSGRPLLGWRERGRACALHSAGPLPRPCRPLAACPAGSVSTAPPCGARRSGRRPAWRTT